MAKGGRDLKQHFDKFKDSVQIGLNSLQQAVHSQQIYPSTLGLQETVKSGWLRKLSRVLKTWQRKWFVIKGDCMYYYFSSSDVKPPQGAVFLPGCRIIEHAFRPNEYEKFVFDIVPETWWKLKSTAQEPNHFSAINKVPGQEIISLSASSEEERTEWIRVIRQILYGPIGGAVFGKPLEEILRFEILRDGSRKIPEIVESCADYILENGIREEGIFRLTGRSSVIKSFCEAYDCGERPRMKDFVDMDVHSASSILKLYLRKLPSPLIPFDHYENFIRAVTRELPIDAGKGMDSLKRAVESLSGPIYDLLQFLCKFLNTVGSRHEVNKMTFSNLATIFSTAFLRPELENDACLLMATANSRKAVTHVLIEHQSWLFDEHATGFDAVIRTEDLLGFSVNAGRSTYEHVGVDSNCSPTNQGHNESKQEEVTMRRSAFVELGSFKQVKQSNRKFLRDGDNLEDIYCRWHSFRKNPPLDEAKEEMFSSRHVKLEDSDVETVSQLAENPLGHLDESTRLENKNISNSNNNNGDDNNHNRNHNSPLEADNFLRPESLSEEECTQSEDGSTRLTFPITLAGNEIHCIESLTRCLETVNVDCLSKEELKLVVHSLLSHIRNKSSL